MQLVRTERPPIKEWNELLSLYNDEIYNKGDWLFRGEKANETLKTSLYKSFEEFEVDNEEKKVKLEQNLIQEFRRNIHLHTDYKAENNLEIIALMQHHGAPTRALDWTRSFFAAVYFAINRRSNNNRYTIWYLNQKWLHEKDKNVLEKKFLEDKNYTDKHFIKKGDLAYLREYSQNNFQNLVVNYIIRQNPELLIYAATPYRINDRLSIQQGALLFSCTIKKTWQENLESMIEEHSKEEKVLLEVSIELTTEKRNEFLRKLYEMNITQASLFPDLDGFAQSLRTRMAYPKSLGI